MGKTDALKRLIIDDDLYADHSKNDLSFLCSHIREEIEYKCEQHASPLDCPDFSIIYRPIIREFGIPIRNGENSSASTYKKIFCCPWCGKKLPKSLKDEFSSTLEKDYGFDLENNEPEDYNIPSEFKSDAWWKQRGL